MTIASLNMPAFAWHTALDLLKSPWRKPRNAAEERMSIFACLTTLTNFVVFPIWSDRLEALETFAIPPASSQHQESNSTPPTRHFGTVNLSRLQNVVRSSKIAHMSGEP